ncbi:unnamed protein product [Lymnaea stagnalis]|uniref:Ig-like domain-containing protein n=1 Tax=Lymnaea stagnalis TaxID=6523 RepID=A0AAV2H4K6_LYMST
METPSSQRLSCLFDVTETVIFRRIYLTLLVSWILVHYGAVRSQTPDDKDIFITSSPHNTIVTFNCTVKDLGSRKVIWSKLSYPYPISIGASRFAPDKRYSVKVDGAVTSLTIRNLEGKDAGEYQCRATGPVYLAAFVSLNFQQGSTYIRPTETEIKSYVHGTIKLPCEVTNLRNFDVLWKNSKDEVLSLMRKIYTDRRFSIVHSKPEEWSLQIKDLRQSDFGFYTCFLNTNPVLTRTVELINESPAETPPVLLEDTHYKKRVTALAGDTIKLICNFRAYPPAKVTWRRRKDGKQEKEVIGEGSTLTLTSVSQQQSGDYICIANNGIRPNAKGKTKLIVEAPQPVTAGVLEPTTTAIPHVPTAPEMYLPHVRTAICRGRTVQLKCTAVGLPRPEIQWKRHGSTLTDGPKYKIEKSSEARHAAHSTLHIRAVSNVDFGKYACMAHNQLGLKNAEQELYEESSAICLAG